MTKNASQLPVNRKVEAYSNPALVAWRRTTFIELAKLKLLSKPHSQTEHFLKRLDAELTRRNTIIQDPELLP